MLGGVLFAAALAASTPARFFVTGDGHVTIVNAHTDERVTTRYRAADRTYDAAAVRRISHLFRSRGDQDETLVSLRLIEVLSHLQRMTGGKPLVLLSGYRSPEYNQDLKQKGGQVAGGSMHTEGLAADVAFARPELPGLWQKLRALECCGAGLYRKQGFMHVDVGKPRFWEPATSKVEQNLSAGNARLLARTEFDRYAAGETIAIRLHAMTVPPVLIAKTARLVPARGDERTVAVAGDGPEREGCFLVEASGGRVRVPDAPALEPGKARIVLSTCAPRVERTPETVETNPLEIVAP